MQVACRGCTVWCVLNISNFEQFCLCFCFSETTLVPLDEVKTVGNRKRSTWQFCASFLNRAKVRLKCVYIYCCIVLGILKTKESNTSYC